MSEGNTVDWSLTDRPFAYIIFPLVVIFIGAFFVTIMFRRRHKRRALGQSGTQWPRDRTSSHAGRPPRQRTRRGNGTNYRWVPWGTTRSQEGLNELGEAPPPYDGKREGSTEVQQTETRDLEAGTLRPPEYPAEPGPVATRDTRYA